MPAATPAPGTSLQVKRMITAPPEEVFQAWTRPEKAGRWLCRVTQQHCTRILEWDLRPGGHYRLEVSKDGNLHFLTGTYQEVNAPQRLAFTWSWEEDPGFGETLVTIEFFRRGTFTEVVLRHEGFLDGQQCENHKSGWQGCFDRLEEALSDAETQG
jgi:uncharacterized protein YndB with AHSA1/START domain